MLRQKVAVLGCLALIVIQGSAFAQRTLIPGSSELSQIGLERAWWAQANLNVARDTVKSVVADETAVVVQSTSGIATAFDAESGRRLWSLQLGRRDSYSYPAAMNEDLVVIVASTRMYGIGKFSGVIEWEMSIKEQPSTSPLLDANRLYLGTMEGSVVAYDVPKIAELFRESKIQGWKHQTLAWSYNTGDRILTPPISNGRDLLFCSRDSSLYSVIAGTGAFNYQFETDSPASAPIGQSGKNILMAARDFRLYCIDSNSGELVWFYPTGRAILNPPIVMGNQVFLLPEPDGILSIDYTSGERQWFRKGMTQFIGATPDLLFVSDSNRNIVGLRRDTGALIGQIAGDRYPIRVSNKRTDRLFLATNSGRLICLRQKGMTFPIYHKFPDRRPIMPEFYDEKAENAGNASDEPVPGSNDVPNDDAGGIIDGNDA